MPSYLLGIDTGTTGSKAILLDERGMVVTSAVTEYPFRTPRPLWAEQDPEDWWAAAVKSIRTVLRQSGIQASSVEGIGLTGQMHGLVLLDSSGRVLRPCIMWNDQRTASECGEITRRIGASRIIELTGNPVLPGFTAPKILWVRNHEPDVLDRTHAFLLPKDYVRFRMSGVFAGDVSDASGTSLFDVRNRRWSPEMCQAVGVPSSWCARVYESPEVGSRLSPEAAQETGLRAGTVIAAGAGDQAAQAIGTGITQEGLVSVTTGTSGVVFASTDTYRVDPHGRLHAFCHAVPGKWHLMGVMLSAGGSLRWYRDALGESEKAAAAETGRDAYDILLEAAARVPAGSNGLVFLPYLTGERTPYPNPHARGVFFGLALTHTKAHLTRAVVEGVTFGLRDSLDLMRGLGVHVKEIRGSGGGARSPHWLQIMADVFGAPLSTVTATEGAAYGAALLGGVAAGVFPSVDEASRTTVRVSSTTAPVDPEAYTAVYRVYRSLYPALLRPFDELARIVLPSTTASGSNTS